MDSIGNKAVNPKLAESAPNSTECEGNESRPTAAASVRVRTHPVPGSQPGLDGALVRCDHRLEDALHLAVQAGGQRLAVAAGDGFRTEAVDGVEAAQLEQALRVGEEGRVAPPQTERWAGGSPGGVR